MFGNKFTGFSLTDLLTRSLVLLNLSEFLGAPHAVLLSLCKKQRAFTFLTPRWWVKLARNNHSHYCTAVCHLSAVCSCSHHWTTRAAVPQIGCKPCPSSTSLHIVVCSLCFHSRAAEVDRQIFVGEVQALVCCEQNGWITMCWVACWILISKQIKKKIT